MSETFSLPPGDASKGARLFKRHCMQCHTSDQEAKKGGNFGPGLFNICGRVSGIYSHKGAGGVATIRSDTVWTDWQLMEYMRDPRTFHGAVTMIFAGIPKEQDRIDITHYLHTLAYPVEPQPTHSKPNLPFGQVQVFKRDK